MEVGDSVAASTFLQSNFHPTLISCQAQRILRNEMWKKRIERGRRGTRRKKNVFHCEGFVRVLIGADRPRSSSSCLLSALPGSEPPWSARPDLSKKMCRLLIESPCGPALSALLCEGVRVCVRGFTWACQVACGEKERCTGKA